MASAVSGYAREAPARRVEPVDDDGRLSCAALGRTELGRCLECPFLITFHPASRMVVCQFDESVMTDIPSSRLIW